jgi:hypothetical protein
MVRPQGATIRVRFEVSEEQQTLQDVAVPFARGSLASDMVERWPVHPSTELER